MPISPATTSRRSSLRSAKDAGELYRAWASLFRLLHHGIDLLLGRELSTAPDGGVPEFRVVTLQRESADDVLREQAVVQVVRVLASLHHKFVKARSTGEKDLRLVAEFIRRIRRFSKILLGEFLHPFASVDRHEDGGHQGDQRLVGADVRSRLLALDV